MANILQVDPGTLKWIIGGLVFATSSFFAWVIHLTVKIYRGAILTVKEQNEIKESLNIKSNKLENKTTDQESRLKEIEKKINKHEEKLEDVENQFKIYSIDVIRITGEVKNIRESMETKIANLKDSMETKIGNVNDSIGRTENTIKGVDNKLNLILTNLVKGQST